LEDPLLPVAAFTIGAGPSRGLSFFDSLFDFHTQALGSVVISPFPFQEGRQTSDNLLTGLYSFSFFCSIGFSKSSCKFQRGESFPSYLPRQGQVFSLSPFTSQALCAMGSILCPFSKASPCVACVRTPPYIQAFLLQPPSFKNSGDPTFSSISSPSS